MKASRCDPLSRSVFAVIGDLVRNERTPILLFWTRLAIGRKTLGGPGWVRYTVTVRCNHNKNFLRVGILSLNKINLRRRHMIFPRKISSRNNDEVFFFKSIFYKSMFYKSSPVQSSPVQSSPVQSSPVHLLQYAIFAYL